MHENSNANAAETVIEINKDIRIALKKLNGHEYEAQISAVFGRREFTYKQRVYAVEGSLDEAIGAAIEFYIKESSQLSKEWYGVYEALREYEAEWRAENSRIQELAMSERKKLREAINLLREELMRHGEFSDWRDADDWVFANLSLTKQNVLSIYEGEEGTVDVSSALDENG